MKRPSILLVLALAMALPLSGCLTSASLDPPPTSPADPLSSWDDLQVPDGSPLARSLAILRTADAALLGPIEPTSVPPRDTDLGAAILSFARAHGHEPTLEERLAIALLGEVPAETAQALLGVLAAFRHLESTTTAAYDAAGGPEVRRIAAAQHAVLEAAVALDDATRTHGLTGLRSAPITVGNVLALDLSGFDDSYTKPFVLVIETGGHDTYLNNAGGNAFSAQHCSSDLDPLPRQPTVAALIDLGGNDQYRPGRDCGTTGGGAYGVGMLIDAGGDDTYEAKGLGATGGGYAHGIGLLIDTGGNDVYTGTGAGVAGGGYAGGVGRLHDHAGNDQYTATDYGANGGARGAWHCVNSCQEAKVSLGILLDLGGSDSYRDLVVRGNDRTVVPKEVTGMQIDLGLMT